MHHKKRGKKMETHKAKRNMYNTKTKIHNKVGLGKRGGAGANKIYECPICSRIILNSEKTIITPCCNKIFHEECLENWCRTSRLDKPLNEVENKAIVPCPLCRGEIVSTCKNEIKITQAQIIDFKNRDDLSFLNLRWILDDDVNDLSSLFRGKKLNVSQYQNIGISDWDVSNVTNMSKMFDGEDAFNQSLDKWNVSKVTNMSSMFDGASSFNQPLNDWNVSKVTNMSGMFYRASSFNQSLNDWDVSKVTNMCFMFYGESSFNQPLNNWNVSKVTNMSGMFKGASSFNQPLNNWNVSKVTYMSSMFEGASSFNQPLNNWNVSNKPDMSSMFYGASSFKQPLGEWKVPVELRPTLYL
jgi:surface protein